MYPLLASLLNKYVHDLINCGLFHAIQVELCWCELFCNVICVQQWWKVWLKAVYIEHWVQTKERWDVEIEGFVTDNLGDGLWPISKQDNIAMGPNKAFLLQM